MEGNGTRAGRGELVGDAKWEINSCKETFMSSVERGSLGSIKPDVWIGLQDISIDKEGGGSKELDLHAGAFAILDKPPRAFWIALSSSVLSGFIK